MGDLPQDNDPFATGDPAATGPAVMRTIERRIVSHLAGESMADLAPTPLTNSVDAYMGVERLEKEKRLVFDKVPLFACLSGDIANPGDITLYDKYGPPVVITRAKDGTVHAFLNMCTHRAGRIAHQCGRHKLMTCTFHGWSFDLEGRLVGVPNRPAFEGEDLSARSLIRMPVGEWGGMIFIKLTPSDERIDVRTWLGDLGPELDHIGLGSGRAIKSDRLEVGANWKFKVDTYGEAYHFNMVHPQTFAVNAIHDFVTYDRYGLHYRVNFVNQFYRDWVGTDESNWPETPYRGGHFIFPNCFIFAVSRGENRAVTTYQLFPGERPDQSSTDMTTYRLADTPPTVSDADVEDLHDYTVQVIGTEDYPVAAQGTRNLKYAPREFRILYGRNEIAVQDFQRNIARMVGEPIDEEA